MTTLALALSLALEPLPLGRTMSVYADRYEGRTMANGRPYRAGALTVASNEWPLGTELEIALGDRSRRVLVTDRMCRTLISPSRGARSRVDASHRLWSELTANAPPGLRRVTVRKVGAKGVPRGV